ncbi:hypothetical protein BDV25DRAFT_137814 [Aspergillus avenaceus]|uniref:Uncharacterized protein n=1 Tax=Aspergillus avenaceus TaxID=36643 RepID=A0A5N6U1M9_ASPAV|nr:hypothetical protein BDV25DRAFT_137814 [Aspergillus avenaceus]
MNLLTKLFSPCLQGRSSKSRSRPQDPETRPPVPPKDGGVPLDTKTRELSKKPSIRIVPRDDDEKGEWKKSEDTVVGGCGGGDFRASFEGVDKKGEEKGEVSDDDITIVTDDEKDKEKDKEKEKESNSPSKQMKVHKSRIIEDIPEETEPDDKTQGSESDNGKSKSVPTWRLSRRKSLIEIINLLQATASAAPKLSGIRVPLSSGSAPSGLRTRGSVASLASSVTVTGEEVKEKESESEKVEMARPPSRALSVDEKKRSVEKKRRRRMGAVGFPGVGVRWSGSNVGRDRALALFC